MAEKPKFATNSANPFRAFKVECESLLIAALKKVSSGHKVEFPKIDVLSTLDDPPNPEYGHLASSVSFELARVLKTKPIDVAKQITEEIRKTRERNLVESVDAAEPGYVNFKADVAKLAQLTLTSIEHEAHGYGLLKSPEPQRVIVEHTSANPARPIHIGTSKNAIFGDTLARILDAHGHHVERRFYIDDTGRQVAQMAYGYKLLGEPAPNGKVDEFFGRIYSIASTLAEVDENKKRLALLKKTKASDLDIVAVTKELDEWVGVAAELQAKHPREFDLLSERISKDPDPQRSIQDLIQKYEKGEPETKALIRRVSEQVLRGFAETLRRAGIHFDQWDWESDMLWSGRVSELLDRLKETGLTHSKGGSWELEVGKAVEKYSLRERLGLSPTFEVTSLTLTRSDGTTLYPTRDIAYTLFKFEKANRVINVIGIEQTLAQLQVKTAVWLLGHRKEAMNFQHFPIGLLVLEGQRMSARRGRYVTFDQLLDEALVRAKEEVDKRSPELSGDLRQRVAERISISAVRYAMLSVESAKSTNFVWDRALNFEANSAPFINYAYTRGLGIRKKLGKLARTTTYNQLTEPAEQNLILTLARFPETFARAAEELNPTLLCLYANSLAQRFHEFYEKSDISHVTNEELKKQRAGLADATGSVIQTLADLLGLELAQRM